MFTWVYLGVPGCTWVYLGLPGVPVVPGVPCVPFTPLLSGVLSLPLLGVPVPTNADTTMQVFLAQKRK